MRRIIYTEEQRKARIKHYIQNAKDKDPIGYQKKKNANNRKRWASLSDEKKIEASIWRVYKLRYVDWHQMFVDQDFKCKICKTPITQECNQKHKGRGHVDHCHSTGKIRGILCHQCNVAMGLVKDDTSILQNMIGYLKEHEQNNSDSSGSTRP